MKNFFLFLFLLPLVMSCHPSRKQVGNHTFYPVVRDGDRLTVDTTRKIRILSTGILVDGRMNGKPKVFRISYIHYVDYPQILIEVDRECEYDDFLRGNPQWLKLSYGPVRYFDLWKHLDLPLWHLDDPGNFVIDSLDLPDSSFGFYLFPDQDEGLNSSAFIGEYENFVASGRKPKRVLFSSSAMDTYTYITDQEVFERLGYRDNTTHRPETARYFPVPISPAHRQYDLLLVFARSDYGPYCSVRTLESGEYIASALFNLDWNNEGEIESEQQSESFDIYDDYSVKEVSTVRYRNGDTVRTLWTLTPYTMNGEGRLLEGASGESLRAMDLSDQTDPPEAKTVLDFLSVYRDFWTTQRLPDEEWLTITVLDIREVLTESRLLSQEYMAELSGRLKEIQKRRETFSPSEMDPDPVFGLKGQDFMIAIDVIPSDAVFLRVYNDNNSYAEVTVDLWSTTVTFRLERENERWVIAETR